MIEFLPAMFLSLPGALLADWLAHPRVAGRDFPLRRLSGMWMTCLVALFSFGIVAGLSGNPVLALIVVVALQLLVVLVSNAKMRLLGEPLLFSDLALIGAMFRHPQFYFSVLALWQKAAGLIAIAVLAAVLLWWFEPNQPMALAGSAIATSAFALLWLSLRLQPFRKLAPRPDILSDVQALGLVPTLILYWLRWRADRQALPSSELGAVPRRPAEEERETDTDRMIVVVQCESFADPLELFGSAGTALPALEEARRESVQYGKLLVSGFGAYTMRTEYGVLFGCDEERLGFRLYDPYLTALNDPALALPQKLGTDRWRSLFVHPHDMRFYGRNQILAKAGFAEMVGEDEFARPDGDGGRYVTDAAVAEKILDLAATASSPSFVYAVTMENHGPWAKHGNSSVGSMVERYNRFVRAGDAMLGRLRHELAALGKPATLAFFGDHRPAIPGASTPGGERHTPYVIVQIDSAGRTIGNAGKQEDLTPAQLHRAILRLGAGIG